MKKRYSKRYNKKCYLKMRDFLVTYIEGTNLIFIWLVYLETAHEEKVKSVAACGASAGFTFFILFDMLNISQNNKIIF